MRILVADDDQQVRDSFRRHLEDQGHEVLQARNGREALPLLDKVDLLLLDLTMPEMTGLELLQAQDRQAASPSLANGGTVVPAPRESLLPTIVISGVSEVKLAVAALKAGAWDYLVKPLADLSILDHAIARAMERRDLLSQIRQYQQNLEELVRQRTAELATANEALERKAIALKEVLKTVNAQKAEAYRGIMTQVQEVMPLLRRVREQATPAFRAVIVNVEESLHKISADPAADPLTRVSAALTPAEMRICKLIREGNSSKEIALAEGIAADTVDTHRRNIRAKLNIRNEKVNLTSYLQSLDESRVTA